MNSTKLCKTYMYSIFYFLIFVNLVNCFSYEVTYTGDNFWIKRSVRPLADEYFSFYLNNIYSTKTHYRADFCGVFAVFFYMCAYATVYKTVYSNPFWNFLFIADNCRNIASYYHMIISVYWFWWVDVLPVFFLLFQDIFCWE